MVRRLCHIVNIASCIITFSIEFFNLLIIALSTGGFLVVIIIIHSIIVIIPFNKKDGNLRIDNTCARITRVSQIMLPEFIFLFLVYSALKYHLPLLSFQHFHIL